MSVGFWILGDCEHQRAVRLDKTGQFAKANNLEQFIVSAKTGEGVTSAITSLIAKCLGIKYKPEVAIIKAEIEPRYTIPSKVEKKSSNVCVIQ